MSIRALLLNCTQRRSPSRSQTQGLVDKAVALFEAENVTCEVVRVIDLDIEHEYWDESDDWAAGEKARRPEDTPWLVERMRAADIVVFATPITGGMCSAMAHIVLQNLNHLEDFAPDTGQYMFYNKVAGMLITGNEDGAQQVASNVLFNLSRLGFTVPPNCEAYWLGPAGTGPGYFEAHGDRHFHTNKLLRYMTKNLTYVAQLLKDHPITTNIKECTEAARVESSDVFAIRINVDNPSLRYRRYQRLGDVPIEQRERRAGGSLTATRTRAGRCRREEAL